MATKLTKLERTAFHEAGHGVVAYLLKIRFSRITLNLKGSAAGQVNFLPPTKSSMRTRAQRRTLMCSRLAVIAAGAMAELVHLGEWDQNGAAQDIRDAKELAGLVRAIVGREEEAPPPDRLVADASSYAKSLLEHPTSRVVVRIVAAELLERGAVTENRVGQLAKLA